MDRVLYVAFDTNVYRKLSRRDLDAIVEAERKAGVLAVASYWPCMELLVHCASAADPDHASARRAIDLLSRHAGYDTNGQRRLRLALDGESTLELVLFGIQPVTRFAEHSAIAWVIGHLATLDAADIPADVVKGLASMAEDVDALEAGFARSMEAFTATVRRAAADDPSTTEAGQRRDMLADLATPRGLVVTARAVVGALGRRHGVALTDDQLEDLAQVALAGFPVTMHLFRQLVSSAITEPAINWDKPARRNSCWDLRVAFHAARDASINGVPVLLVSDDKGIVNAARDAGCTEVLMQLDEYGQMLDSGGVRERAAAICQMPTTMAKVPHLVELQVPQP